MNVEEIGERLYRKVVTAVWSDDRQTYTGGCIVRGENGSVSVRFYRYQVGKGIVGRCRPTDEMSQLLKQYGQELKAYVIREAELEDLHQQRLGAGNCRRQAQSYQPIHSRTPPPVSGSEKPKKDLQHDAEGLRTQLTNEN